MSSVISAGDAAPKVHLETTSGKVSIPTGSGRGLILFFYPKDNTPGCTNEAKDFTAMKDAFDKKGFDIIGISRDSLASHEKTDPYAKPSVSGRKRTCMAAHSWALNALLSPSAPMA